MQPERARQCRVCSTLSSSLPRELLVAGEIFISFLSICLSFPPSFHPSLLCRSQTHARSPKISNTLFLNSGERQGRLRYVAKIILIKGLIPLTSLKNNSKVLTGTKNFKCLLFRGTKAYCCTRPNFVKLSVFPYPIQNIEIFPLLFSASICKKVTFPFRRQ